MYWPRMTAGLTEAVQRCEACQQMKRTPKGTYDDLSSSNATMANYC